MSHDIAFLHTAAGHVTTFGALMAEMAPDLVARHDVDESLLAEARAVGGIGAGLQERIDQAMVDAGSSGAGVVVCTCSTIGGAAERAGQGRALITQRIDRAMADAAVELGPRIMVVAALRSTIVPTRKLIADSAARIGKPVSFKDLVVEEAWTYFERSMLEAYVEQIAAAVRANSGKADVVVLAQASMAGAAELCRSLSTPVLASPRLGVEAALEAWKLSTSDRGPYEDLQE